MNLFIWNNISFELYWSKSCKLQGGVSPDQKLAIIVDNMGDLNMELNKLAFRQYASNGKEIT